MAGITDSTKNDNSSFVIDSTRKDFTSTYQYREKEPKERQENISNGKKLFDEAVRKAEREKPNKQEIIDSTKLVRSLLKKGFKNRQSKYLQQPHLIFFRYNARDKDEVFDQSPLCLTLSASSTHMLGLNLAWLPQKLRTALIDIVLKSNKTLIKKQMPLNISYKTLKALIYSLQATPAIRLYIIKRMSTRVAVLPYEYWMQACKMDTSSFTNGASSDSMYRYALSKKKGKR